LVVDAVGHHSCISLRAERAGDDFDDDDDDDGVVAMRSPVANVASSCPIEVRLSIIITACCFASMPQVQV
jgi:hypothetical protein